MIIWAGLCPLGSLLLEDLRSTSFWIVGFAALLILSAALQPVLSPTALPEPFVTWFFVLNIGAVITITFGLLYYFVGRRNFFQQQAEMLLLNILPKETSVRSPTNILRLVSCLQTWLNLRRWQPR